jgi:hypothetical protein
VVKALDDFTSKAYARKIAAGKQPGDIHDIRGLVTDASQAMGQLQELAGVLERLLLSPGWEQRLPQLLQVLDRVEAEGEDFVDFASSQVLVTGALLSLVLLLGCVVAGLIYQYASRRLFGARP